MQKREDRNLEISIQQLVVSSQQGKDIPGRPDI